MAQSHGGGPAPSIPDNEVWYYAPAQVTLYLSTGVVSHTFSDGKGVLTFADPVTRMSRWLRSTAITDVKMPETVTEIYASSFVDCSSLALTSLPNGVTSIGNTTFYSCSSLALTSLPSGITRIEKNAFYSCYSLALTSLPNGVTSIGNTAFYRCRSLHLLSLPSGVTSIGSSAFDGCTAIQSLTIDRADPPTLGSSAFNNTSFPIYVPASAVDTYKAASGWSTYASRIFAIPE